MRITISRLLKGAVASAVILLSTHFVYATETDSIGQATFVIGEVGARDPAGEMRALARGGELFRGDVIVTGATGAAQFRFADDSRMVVRRSSEVVLDEFDFGAEKESFVARLTFGALRSITGLIGKHNKQNVAFQTAVATIGIRGTDFEVVHIPLAKPELFGAGEKIEPGTYNKVYSGGTQLVSKGGTIDLNINESGFIGLAAGIGKTPVKIDQLPAVLLKVIGSTPQIGKAPEAAPSPGTNPQGEPTASGELTTNEGTSSSPGPAGAPVRTAPATISDGSSLPVRDGITTLKTAPLSTTLQSTTLAPLSTTLQTTTTTAPLSTTLQSTTLAPLSTTLQTTTTTAPLSTTLQSTTLAPLSTTLQTTTTTAPLSTTLQSTTISPSTTTILSSPLLKK
jgi:FecR protein